MGRTYRNNLAYATPEPIITAPIANKAYGTPVPLVGTVVVLFLAELSVDNDGD
jgi:hypothetical protein